MVLLVDDDEDLLEVLGMLFKHAGIPSVAARSLRGVQALGAELATVTTAILDVNLGHGEPSGVDIARWLRAQSYTMRTVFITGHAPDHPLVREIGDGEVLEKPVDPRILIKVARGER
jgi:DNA-binding response OmpR family regulator